MTGQALRVRELESKPEEGGFATPSPFVEEQFRRDGLERLLDIVVGNETLTFDDIPLLTSARLAHLAACARLKHSKIPERDYVRPVVCLPVARFLEIHGEARATSQLLAFLERLASVRGRMPIAIYAAVDRWRGAFTGEALLSTLVAMKRENRCNLQLLGPSTAELEELFEHGERRDLERFLTDLHNLGFSRIDGGTSLEIHRLCAKLGFSITVGQDISCVQDAVGLLGPIHDREETRLIEERFLSDLLSIADKLVPTGKLRCWFPWSRFGRTPLHHSLDAPFAEPLLRMIAFARLVLPPSTRIRAPFSLFGKYLALVALQFGASDLGYAALDSESATQLALHPFTHVSGERPS